MTPAVVAEQVSKTYRTYTRPWDRIAERLGAGPRHRAHHALRAVSFELPRGEAIGVVGENGAGKSTLLKILSGITPPTAGRVHVAGTVAAILELGSGFHPDFTGRQNIALNAAMLGLSRAAVARAMPEIIDFSELGAFIDQPVGHYSTGMAMRLAFSIAVQVDPDVLIVDEALSVGDGYFQKKCMDRLRRFLDAGGTLLFCSHAMYYVSAFCRRALWLRNGAMAGLGPTSEVVPAYEAFLESKRAHTCKDAGEQNGGTAARESAAAAPVRIEAIAAEHAGTRDALVPGAQIEVATGESLAIEVRWRCEQSARPIHVAIGINRSSDGLEVCAFGSHQQGSPPILAGPHDRIVLELPALTLVKGSFDLYIFLLDEAGLHIYDQRVLAEVLRVRQGPYTFGVVTMPHRWQV